MSSVTELNSINPELHTNKIIMSEHAYEMAKERFNLKDKNVALGTVRGWLRRAKKIGRVTSELGDETILYAFQGIGIFLSLDLKKVVTLYKREGVTYEPIKRKVIDLHMSRFRALSRIESSRDKKLKLETLRINIEISQLKYRRAKTRSDNVKKECTNRIKELEYYIEGLKTELEDVKNEKRRVAKSMIGVI